MKYFIFLIISFSVFSSNLVCDWVKDENGSPMRIHFDSEKKVSSTYGRCYFNNKNIIVCRLPQRGKIKIYLSKGFLENGESLRFPAKLQNGRILRSKNYRCVLDKEPI